MDKAIMIGGKLTDVDDSAIDDFIIKGSKWFTANYNEFVEVLKLVMKDYETFLSKSEILRIENKENFSMEKMIDKFKSLIPLEVKDEPIQKQLNLPKLNKIK
jgi:hypothetical protein